MGNSKSIAWSVADVLRGSVRDRYCSYIVVVAICHAKRAALLTETDCCVYDEDFNRMLYEALLETNADEHVAHLVSDVILTNRYLDDPRNVVRRVYEMLPNDINELVDIVLDIELEEEFVSQFMRIEGITPSSVTALAIKLLSIKDGEQVADFGTGTGSFLVKASQQADCELIYGCDVKSDSVAIAKIRAEAIGPNVVVEQADMFHIDGVFDKCFSNYPFGSKSRHFKNDAIESLNRQGYEDIPRFSSSDWIFNLQLLARLKDGGKAVGVMTRGSSFNGADEKIRRYFIANGWIEAAISLPSGMFSPYSGIATTMLVLSRGNEKVRLIDASEICQKGRRETSFSDEDIARISTLMTNDEAGLSCSLTYDELANDGFILNPERHLGENINVKNGVSIESLSLNITRGSGWAKKQLEEFNSNVPTKFRYLMLKNIVDGELEEDLPFLAGIEDSQKKYCVQNGDLLLSKIGPNFKVAVADIPKDETVLATGNLYIIRLNTEEVDPRYVKLYLESDQGVAQLRRACVGTTMPSIPAKAFDDILIPKISTDDQAKIIERYEALRREIGIHKVAIENAHQKMASLLAEE